MDYTAFRKVLVQASSDQQKKHVETKALAMAKEMLQKSQLEQAETAAKFGSQMAVSHDVNMAA